MNIHEKINYLEFLSENVQKTKTFFNLVSGWSFFDYRPKYTALSNEGIGGGSIIKPISEFLGGKRFHFEDSNRNKYTVWSDENK
jgi:predicted enzyme related to lactoylglutathione lyase